MSLSKYNLPIKTFIWGMLGATVSLYILKSPLRLFGQILLILSALMFILAMHQLFKIKKHFPLLISI